MLLIGDVALAHDIGGLLAARRLGLKLTIVLLDNGGGGIFDFLPVVARAAGAQDDDLYDAPRRDADRPRLRRGGARSTASATSASQDVARFRAALERALGAAGSAIVEVRGRARARTSTLHRRVWEAGRRAALSQARAAAAAPRA